MKKQLTSLAICIAALVGCSTSDTDSSLTPQNNGKTPFAIQVSNGQETKAVLGDSEGGKVPIYWENNDRIALYRTSDWSDQSATVRDLMSFDDYGESKSNAQFSGYITVAPNKGGDLWVALYSPELKDYEFNDDNYIDEHCLISTNGESALTMISVPENQDGTWDGIMAAVKKTSSSSEKLAFTFTNLMPVVELKMTNDGKKAVTVSKVEYSNVVGAAMEGYIFVDKQAMNKPKFVPYYDRVNQIKTVTVDKKITIAAGANAAVHITVPPTIDPNVPTPDYALYGFALKVTLSDGTTVTKAYPNYVGRATYYTTTINLSADVDQNKVINVIVPGSLPTLLKYNGYNGSNMPTKLTIKGTLNMNDFQMGLFRYASSITELDLKDATIPEGTKFNSFSNVKKIVLPDNYTAISDQSFPGCGKLEAISGAGVESIGKDAFTGLKNLKSVDFPKATTIGKHAFQGCSMLESAYFPEALTLGESAFMYCSALKSADFEKAQTINNYVFMDCESLASINFPKVTKIGQHVFQGCTSLESVRFPKVTSIAADGFKNCTGLKSIDLPSVTSLFNAFDTCTALTTVKLGAKLDYFGTSVFNGGKTSGCDLYLNSAEMPASGLVWRGYTWKSIKSYN